MGDERISVLRSPGDVLVVAAGVPDAGCPRWPIRSGSPAPAMPWCGEEALRQSSATRRRAGAPRSAQPCTNSNPKRPFTQRFPWVTSWSWGEVTFTMRFSWTCTSRLQPTPQ